MQTHVCGAHDRTLDHRTGITCLKRDPEMLSSPSEALV
jgi:hypothetical protein